jgi:acetyl esterase/lipase
MSFDDLPPQPAPIHEAARGYGERILEKTRQVQRTSRCVLDVAYGGDSRQKLDIYLPQEERRGLPVLCFLHGGAWRIGYKEWMGFMAPGITSLPAIFVSVSYRLVPAVQFPLPLEDCYDAVVWVWKHISAHGGDPGRIQIGGHSAGGHLTALAALRPEGFVVRRAPPDVVKACHALSAPFDLRPGTRGPNEEAAVTAFLGGRSRDVASPICHVRPPIPPFFVAYGSEDFPHTRAQGPAMAAALRDAGGRVTMRVFEGCDHFAASERCADPDFEWVRVARECLADVR